MNRPVRSPRPRSSASVIRAVDVLPLVPVMWMTGQARCGSPSSPTSSAIRSRARSTECSGRRAMISRSTSRIRASMSTLPAYVRWRASPRAAGSDRGEALLEPGDVGLGGRQPLAGLVHHRGGRLGGEAGVGQLPLRLLGLARAAARSFSIRRRSAATSMAPAMSSSTVMPSTSSDADAVKPSAGRVEPQQRPDPLLVAGQRRGLDAGQPGRAPAGRAAAPDRNGTGGSRSPAASSRRSPPRPPGRRTRTPARPRP